MKEDFRPISNTAPEGLYGRLKFFARFIFDLQNLSIYRCLRKYLKNIKGRVLDIGCGDAPYRHLLNKDCQYTGTDIKDQRKFDYRKENILYLENDKIMVPDESFDALICTEVLEHVSQPSKLISEMKRILRKGGTGIITVPWSARFHYIPDDYFRYTPSGLRIMFRDFSDIIIEERGTDITAICSKIIVASVRMIKPNSIVKWILLPILIAACIPFIVSAVILGHVSLRYNLGSTQDPLGYTVYIIN